MIDLLELAVMNLRNVHGNSMILTVEEIKELTSCVSETCVNIEMVQNTKSATIICLLD